MREEKDSLGTVRVPDDAYYGAGTQRAIDNFPISGAGLPDDFIQALALIKQCAAAVNGQLGLLEPAIADVIQETAREIRDGQLLNQFRVDVFQTGSGTSTNMNMNEVIASRANEKITGVRGGKSPVHPNDHVNLGQSSNDVVPSAIHIAARINIQKELLPALSTLKKALAGKAELFADVPKLGRTHLQDAVPMTLGQEFSGYARQIELGIERISRASHELVELALGGTAVGTGINTHPQFAQKTIAAVSEQLGLDFQEAANHFESQGAKDAVVSVSGALKTVAVSLVKIANDIRLLGSGPRCGLGEIILPAVQPGSSIMPGKVNPVIPEAIIQVAAQVMGNDTTIMIAGQGGYFELNAMMPVMASSLLQSIRLLTGAIRVFTEKCVQNLAADRKACRASIEKSLALATYLVPELGYDRSSEIAKTAYETGQTIREVLLEKQILPAEKIEALLKGIDGSQDPQS